MADPVLDIQPYSLGQFCDYAHELYTSERTDEFVDFVLSGIHENRQASIDVVLNRIPDEEIPQLQLQRDYDSVLGIDKHIRIQDLPITVWLVPRFEDTLKTNVHLKYHFVNDTGHHEAPYHKIPHLALGKSDTHTLIRVLFPDLYGPDRKSFHMMKAEQVDFFEKGILPTMRELLGHMGNDLPPDYEAEIFRARQTTGRFSFSTRVLPRWQTEHFGDTLRRNLVANGVGWGRNLVFLHQIRGIKSGNPHAGLDRLNSEAALVECLEQHGIDLDTVMRSGEWYVDVGVEIFSNLERCMAWRTDKHATLAEHVLQIPARDAHRITTLTSSKYQRDPASHLIGASGLRITPGIRAEGPLEVQYMQAYLTDKAIIYNPEHGRFGKYITAYQLLQGKGPDYIRSLYRLYRAATGNNRSSARLELRVPVRHAPDALLDLDPMVLCDCLLSFTVWEWWFFKAWRALACKHLTDWQREGPTDLRLANSALLLTAGLSWILNGIHSSPDLGPSSRELLNAVLPRARLRDLERDQLPFPITIPNDDDPDRDPSPFWDEDEGQMDHGVTTRPLPDAEDETEFESIAGRNTLVPYVPYGVFFLRRRRPDAPVPRLFDIGIRITNKTFKFFFGKDKEDIMLMFERADATHPRDPSRLHNRTRLRAIAAPGPGQQLTFNLEASGHQLLPPLRDDGSDLSAAEDDDGPNEIEDPGLDRNMTRVWSQFLVDVIKVIPNHKSASQGSYGVIPPAELDNVDIEVFQNINLAATFHDVQWTIATPKMWKDAFKHLWPAKGVKKQGVVQNYLTTAYYVMWQQMTQRMTEETAKKAREGIWAKFQELEWAPFARSDRIWCTKPVPTKFKRSSGEDPLNPAPKVVMRHQAPTWEVARPIDA